MMVVNTNIITTNNKHNHLPASTEQANINATRRQTTRNFMVCVGLFGV